MCRYMNINAFGTDNYLRGHIRGRLERIQRDDAVRGNSESLLVASVANEIAIRSFFMKASISYPQRSSSRLANLAVFGQAVFLLHVCEMSSKAGSTCTIRTR